MSITAYNARLINASNFAVISPHAGNIYFTGDRGDFSCPDLGILRRFYLLITRQCLTAG